jgi:hypothetical protein
MKRFLLLLALAFLALSGQVHARGTVPVVNYENVQLAGGSGKPLSVDAVKQAIRTAAAAKSWAVTPDGDALTATLVVRNKHTVVVGITVSGDKYSLQFKDAVNMNVTERDGLKLIHPFYNRWVQELNEAIRVELLKL